MSYTKQTWLNSPPSKDTPLSAARFNHMEDGIEAADATASAAVPSARKINGHALSGDVTLIASDFDLGNVDNTSDATKPISTAAAAALATKADADETVSGSANGTATSLVLWTGTDAQFAAVTEKDPSTIYVRPGGISIGASPVFTGVPRTYSVTVDHTKVAAAVTDFPLFVDLSDMPDVFWTVVANGGGDIRCYSGAVELPREVVSCDTVARTGELHIKCDLSATADTAITVTVDGSSPDYAPTDPCGRNAVWSNGFVVVSHDGGKTDSTVNGLNGSLTGTLGDPVLGKLGKTAQQYVGAGYYTLPNNALTQLNNGTISVWLKKLATNSFTQIILIKPSAYNFAYNDSTGLTAYDYSQNPVAVIQSGEGAILRDGNWHYGAETFQSGVSNGSSLSVDGVKKVNFSTSIASQANKVGIGGFNPIDTGELNNAILDEIRLANVARSPAWIGTEYANQNNPATFYTATPA